MAATLAAASARPVSQPRVRQHPCVCKYAGAGRPSPRVIARGVAEDDDDGLGDLANNIHEGESRRRTCAADVVRVALHGRRTDDDDAIERCIKRLPLPDLRVPSSLLNLASPESLRNSLHPRKLRVPDVEDALVRGCELTPGPREDGAKRMWCRKANEYLAELFLLAGLSLEGPRRLYPLSRFDLFHGHLWTGTTSRDDRDVPVVGLLMHAMEYPGVDPAVGFEVNLGNCQSGSSCVYDEAALAERNLLWVASADEGWAEFCVLDTSEGNTLSERGLCVVPELHTTFEGDFGEVAGDVLYLHGTGDRRPREAVFAFPR